MKRSLVVLLFSSSFVLSFSLPTSVFSRFSQETAQQKGLFTIKAGLTVAKKAANSWDSGAFYTGSSFTPASETMFKTGKRLAWEFGFATRSKCPAGRYRVMHVIVSADDRDIKLAKKLVDGYAVTVGGEADRDPPLPAMVDEDFMDAERVLRAGEKYGGEKLLDFKQLDIASLGGGTVWILRIQDYRVVLNARTGAFIYKGKNDGAPESLEHFSKKLGLKETEELLRKEVQKWGKEKPGEIQITSIEARALSAEGFAKTGQFDWSVWEFVVPKPEVVWFRVEVANGRVLWPTARITSLDDQKRFENVVELKPPDGEKLRKAIEPNEKLKAWLEAGKGTVKLRVVDAQQVAMTFMPADTKRDELVLRYEPETGKVE